MEKQLVKKLAKIMGEINNVEKNGFNAFHKYNYAMEQDMLVAVRKKLSDANIFIVTDVKTVTVQETGKEGFLTTIQTVHAFHDGDTGETLYASSAGQGTDKGDKGIYKAITGATKYFISKNFLIPTGDDPESFDEKRDQAGRVPKEAVKAQEVPQAKPSPNMPPNPWVGKLVTMAAPVKGGTGAGWTRWDLETSGHAGKDFKLSIFSSSIAEVAANAISDGETVELVWKAKKDSKGNLWNTVDTITILKGDK